jgi:polyhydroxyalkanoate synthesis regulator phasin
MVDTDKTTTESEKLKESSTAGTSTDGSFTTEQFVKYTQEILKNAAEEWKKAQAEYKREVKEIRDNLEKLKKDNDNPERSSFK